MNRQYSFGKQVNLEFDATIARVTEELQKQGFGVLSDIDVSGTLKKKIGVDFPRYRILGACNPQFAHKALTAEPEIGALLPCNVVVREDGAGKVRVDIMDPKAVLKLVDNKAVESIAAEVRQRLEQVFAAL